MGTHMPMREMGRNKGTAGHKRVTNQLDSGHSRLENMACGPFLWDSEYWMLREYHSDMVFTLS